MRVSSIAEYIDSIMKIDLKDDEMLLYRGHADSSYKLLPGIYRNKEKDIERKNYRQCMVDYPEEFSKDHVNNLAIIQHYKTNTRLLDFTTNPLIALNIAIGNDMDCDAEIVIVKVDKNDILHHTSDKAMMLACLANFSDEEKNEIRRFCKKYENRVVIDENLIKNNHTMKRFLHEIRRECPAFDCEIVPKDLLNSYFIMTYKSSKRIKLQDGMFMIFGLFDKNQDENPVEKKVIEQCIIKKSDRKKVKDELKRLVLTERKLYPDFSYLEKEVFYEL